MCCKSNFSSFPRCTVKLVCRPESSFVTLCHKLHELLTISSTLPPIDERATARGTHDVRPHRIGRTHPHAGGRVIRNSHQDTWQISCSCPPCVILRKP
eukprot:1828560-Amphidinium_carterae.1